jgi:hypothetical protein
MLTDSENEALWDALLSREPERIWQAFSALDDASLAAVRKHLRKMVGEPGWHPEQVKSARAALKALKDLA